MMTQSLVSFMRTEEVSCTKANEKRLRYMLYRSYRQDNMFYTKKCISFSHVFEQKNTICSYELFSNLDYFICC